jgi:hypothetical protein
MKKALFSIVLLAVFSLFSLATIAQGTIKGVVVDAETNEALIGASVVLEGTTTGTVTDIDGAFTLSVATGDQKVQVSYIGYTTQTLNVKVSGETNMGEILLKPDAVGINEVMVLASVAVQRKTPVAVSSIEPQQIAEKLGTQEYPEILKSTPGVYATKQGGGLGDSRINIRGFNQRNVAVMINGVPVNDMENGWVYWSNWAGLSEVTRSMQVQRGLGASKLSTGSVGGTINIITKSTDAEQGGSIYTAIGNDGLKKTSFSLSSGLGEKGWAMTLSGSHLTRDGWVDGTWADNWSYFFSVSKRWTNHMLSFTAFGAPQRHGQRSTTQSIEEVQKPSKGLQYNPDWGYKDGQLLSLRENFYHKPQMSLNSYWTISDRAMLSTSAYYSFGSGGGTGPYGENQNAFYSYKKEGQIDYDRIVAENIAAGNAGSQAILRASRNDHNWMGVISNLQYELNDARDLSFGVELRSYTGKHFREVEDLMGGEFVVSEDDENEPYKIAKEGDKIGYWNDGKVGWQGVFAQLEYSKNDLSAFVAGSFNNQMTKRIDYFNYLDSDPEQETDWQNHQAFQVKGGANYNLNDHHNVFANVGYFTKAPIFDAIFINYVNDINEGAVNEKVLSLELGYGFRTHNFNANVNGYYTEWNDKFFRQRIFLPDGEVFQANIEGVNARHMGLEADFKWKPTKNLTLNGAVTLSDNIWTNDLDNVPIYDDDQNLIGHVDLFIKDLKVGDAAQTILHLDANYELFKGFKVGANWTYFDNLYAEYDPTGRGDEDKRGVQPWKVPSVGLVDANFVYNFKIGDFDAALMGNINNLFNTEYISDADDGKDNDWKTAKVYYGVGRNWMTSLRINF